MSSDIFFVSFRRLLCCLLLVACVCLFLSFFFFKLSGDHRDLHVLTHSFPTRRSSDLHSFSCWSGSDIGGYLSGPATLQCAPGGNGPLRLSFVAGHRDEAIADSSVRCCSTGDAGGSRANLEAVPPASCRLRHCQAAQFPEPVGVRSEEQTSELQAIMRIT